MMVRPEWNVTWAHVRDSDTRFAFWESPSCADAVVRPVGRSGLAFQILAQDCAHAPAMVPVVIGELLGQTVDADLMTVSANPDPFERRELGGSQLLDEFVTQRTEFLDCLVAVA